ncbi:Fic family protein [Hoyosella sp. G463]|uniref:Fic family protein n=1 Tax=Lolliginicoccus lacisalsi TaxID=2742202 RepID=A0A927PMD0_9ACTN|nr:Fic family protein [Lolliginicoccus lacisalsi]MBD8506689.1 Fic family protein [Lolliginicoccus lacisalsi]
MASEASWPSLGSETRPWVPRIPPDLVAAAIRHRHAGPYQAAVAPSIAHQQLVLPGDVLALAEQAATELARFDAELGTDIAPFAAVLLRSESASSSMIENLTSGAKAIVLAELGETGKRNATSIVANTRAMRAALDLADRLSPDAILDMHKALMEGVDPRAGQWREEQVWIGGTTYGPHDAAFIPPHHEHVPALLDDLTAFLRRTDMPVLILAAIAHAQFETIHPFTDGNGRTGRALVHSLLRGRGLARNVTIPISAGLLTDTSRYFAALTAYRDGEPERIVATFAEAAFAATSNGRALVADLRGIRANWDTAIAARRGASSWRLADLLLRQPIVDAATVATELGIAPQNALRAIGPLVEAGILTEFTGQQRNRMWQARAVLDAIDAFADRARRRAP